MRKALLALLIVPLFVARISDPTRNVRPPAHPPGFPITIDRSVPYSPQPSVLLFPLDGTDFAMTSAAAGVLFDIDGDGLRERVAWPQAGANVAFLALDLNGDGQITSGTELFAGGMPSERRRSVHVLTDTFLKSASESGSIHAGHDLYDRLLLWVDRNHDGMSDPTELTKARDRFTAIGLGYSSATWADTHGNRVRFEGWMHVRTEGPDQGESASAAEDRQRTRHYFEVELQTASIR